MFKYPWHAWTWTIKGYRSKSFPPDRLSPFSKSRFSITTQSLPVSGPTEGGSPKNVWWDGSKPLPTRWSGVSFSVWRLRLSVTNLVLRLGKRNWVFEHRFRASCIDTSINNDNHLLYLRCLLTIRASFPWPVDENFIFWVIWQGYPTCLKWVRWSRKW